MAKMIGSMIKEIGGNVERFAGKRVREKVMEGSEQITSRGASKGKTAEWVKGAMEKLDELVDEKTRFQIMENCGYKCSMINNGVIERAKARRKKYRSMDDFLMAEQKHPITGTRLERIGNTLYQYYTPQSFTRPMRCYCALLRGLPADEKVSITYCHCSQGFVGKLWEKVLERPVKVDLIQSVVTGAHECKFEVHI